VKIAVLRKGLADLALSMAAAHFKRYTSKARDYESFPDFNTNLCFDWTLVINLLKT